LNKRRIGLFIAILVVALWASTPAQLEYDPAATLPPLPEPVLIPGTEERVRLAAGGERTDWAVVVLHGFSATRQETAPLGELVAAELGANLFEARLSGHGHARDPMAGVRAEHWLADTARALAKGAELGDKLVVIGTSTGATLAAAMLDQPVANAIDTLVMISPNFAPQGAGAHWLTGPAGPLLGWLAEGLTRCWDTDNELQARFWSTCYPTTTLVEVMRLVDFVGGRLPDRISQRLLVFYSPEDSVVSPDAISAAYSGVDAPAKALVDVAASGDPSHHVLAGDILSPGTTTDIAAQIVAFIRRPAP
jgi:esterase/lipase